MSHFYKLGSSVAPPSNSPVPVPIPPYHHVVEDHTFRSLPPRGSRLVFPSAQALGSVEICDSLKV
jgi:hypothetical protein